MTCAEWTGTSIVDVEVQSITALHSDVSIFHEEWHLALEPHVSFRVVDGIF